MSVLERQKQSLISDGLFNTLTSNRGFTSKGWFFFSQKVEHEGTILTFFMYNPLPRFLSGNAAQWLGCQGPTESNIQEQSLGFSTVSCLSPHQRAGEVIPDWCISPYVCCGFKNMRPRESPWNRPWDVSGCYQSKKCLLMPLGGR